VGWYFRKSKKLGPFRVTVSKSGVSVSAGVKGARITKGPRGTHLTVGAGGFYCRERLDQPTQRSGVAPVHPPVTTVPPPPSHQELTFGWAVRFVGIVLLVILGLALLAASLLHSSGTP